MNKVKKLTVLGIICLIVTAAGAAEKDGGTLRFDGRTAYGAKHCKALDLEDAVTMEAWINPGALSGSGRIIDKDDSAYLLDTWPGYSLRMIPGNAPIGFPAKLPRGKWSHVAGVYCRTEGVRKLYVNGKEVASTGAGSMPKMKRNRLPLRIGCGTRTSGHRFRGEMDRVTIYNRALTAKEIAALAADATHKSHNLAGTVADWGFEKSVKGIYTGSGPGKLKLSPIRGGATVSGPAAELTGLAPPPKGRLTLWWRKPAGNWNDATPVGNGRLGAMLFGGVRTERLQLNEDTLWGGGPYDPSNPQSLKVLPKVRELIFAGKAREAAALANQMMAKPLRQMPYQTVGDVILDFETHESAADYRRDLDMDSAVARITYIANGVKYKRELLSSAVDQAIVMQLTADKPGKISFSAAMTTPQKADVRTVGTDLLTLTGISGDAQGIPGQVRFQARLKVLAKGGKTAADDDRITVSGADSAMLIIAAATNYKNYRDITGDPAALATARIVKAAKRPFEKIRDDHVAEYRKLFRRVALDVGSSDAMKLPTDERIRQFGEGKDPQLAELYFQFGRYLLISSSRPGCQPANLQGIWNPHMRPPWESKYTININQEMNYWPAEMCNLAECHEPQLRMVTEVAVTGRRTAKVNYGARGWVCHHNIDHWRATAPIDGVKWGMWPTGGAWMAQHLWEHYLYGGDVEFLRRVYPVMKGAATFFLDTLVEHPTRKWLVTCPSSSPEHGGLRAGPTMDSQILRDLFGNCIEASKILGTDEDERFRKQATAARKRLAPMLIGKHGQLQEWIEDDDDPRNKHRHVSHLYGLHPSNQITRRGTPKLFAAARKSLEFRGDGGTGWSKAWKINFWARLEDGDHAHKMFSELIVRSTYPSLLDRCPPFVIDANFGGTSGITEMLLQSHVAAAADGKAPETDSGMDREIHLLPALPKAWPAGSVTGLRARGGFGVDIVWKAGKLTEATIRSNLGRTCTVRYGEKLIRFKTNKGQTYRLDGKLERK